MSVCPSSFIQERKYLHNVSPATITWYEQSFKRFEGALDSRASVIQRIEELRTRGLSPVSVNVHLRCINAYFNWLHEEHGKELVKIPKLKEEEKILVTLGAVELSRLLRPAGGTRRSHLIALTILDTGLRASEVLSLTKEDVDLNNLVLKVRGKGGKHRLVPFSYELRKSLFRHLNLVLQPLGVVFGTKNNTRSPFGTLNGISRDSGRSWVSAGFTRTCLGIHLLVNT